MDNLHPTVNDREKAYVDKYLKDLTDMEDINKRFQLQ